MSRSRNTAWKKKPARPWWAWRYFEDIEHKINQDFKKDYKEMLSDHYLYHAAVCLCYECTLAIFLDIAE